MQLDDATQASIEQAEAELHKTFAMLSQEEQKYADIFLTLIYSVGMYRWKQEKPLESIITEYLAKAKNDQVHRISSVLGLNEMMLRNMMSLKVECE